MDVKTAFLNGFLKEELYMLQPDGFVDPNGANKVSKLKRSIYGLVQACRSWNICSDEMINVFGFIHSLWETSIYTKVSGTTIEFLISVCSWHIIDPKWCRISGKHKGLFERGFSKEDLDKATYILGIKIHRDRSRRLMILSKDSTPWHDFERVQNRSAKKEFLAVLQGVSIEWDSRPDHNRR